MEDFLKMGSFALPPPHGGIPEEADGKPDDDDDGATLPSPTDEDIHEALMTGKGLKRSNDGQNPPAKRRSWPLRSSEGSVASDRLLRPPQPAVDSSGSASNSSASRIMPPPPPPSREPGPDGWKKGNAPWRPGVQGGQARYGIAGGQNRDWHRMRARAERQGPDALKQFHKENPHPKELAKAWDYFQQHGGDQK